jgi:hypothetical protein
MYICAVYVNEISYAVVMDWITNTQEYFMSITTDDGECLYSSLSEPIKLISLDKYIAILQSFGIYLPDRLIAAWGNMSR